METFEEKQTKITMLEGDNNKDDTVRTFVFNEEDHTLGNSLRYMIMKKEGNIVGKGGIAHHEQFLLFPQCFPKTSTTDSPDVNFCGYNIPHPSEDKIHVRIQTHGKPAKDALMNGLKDLGTLSEHVLRTYEKSVNDYKRRNQSPD